MNSGAGEEHTEKSTKEETSKRDLRGKDKEEEGS